jgi:hypothetical protein
MLSADAKKEMLSASGDNLAGAINPWLIKGEEIRNISRIILSIR